MQFKYCFCSKVIITSLEVISWETWPVSQLGVFVSYAYKAFLVGQLRVGTRGARAETH